MEDTSSWGPEAVPQAEDNLGPLAFDQPGAAEAAVLEDAGRKAPRTMIQHVFQTE
jgi:hypothetical protein